MFKKVKYLSVALIVLASAIPAWTAFAAQDVKVFFNGAEISYDVPPQIIDDRTMVPLRLTIESITGETMQWDDAAKTVTFNAGGHTNKHTIGQKTVYADGAPVEFDTPSLIIDSRTLVPVRMIAETSGCKVDWDPANYHVLITSAATPEPEPEPEAPPADTVVKIGSITANKKEMNAGESVVLTVSTNSLAEYVWVEYDDTSSKAELVSTDASGNKTWTVTCSPTESQQLNILANTEDSSEGAVNKRQGITVESLDVVITDVSSNRASITAGTNTTLTIKTNDKATDVWVTYDGGGLEASLVSRDGPNKKTWKVECSPVKTQTITIYANTSHTDKGAATKKLKIEVIGGSGVVNPKILSSSADTLETRPGERIVFTVKTNSATKNVWAGLDSGETCEGFLQETDKNNNKTWQIIYYPQESVPVTIYAGSESKSTSIKSDTASEVVNVSVY